MSGPWPRKRLWLSAAIGTTTSLSAWFGMTHRGPDWIEPVSTMLLLPGMFPAMMISGNVHAFSLFVAAVFSSSLYTAAMYFAAVIWRRLRQE